MLIAGEGAQFDYTVNTVRVRALANGQIDNVVVTFRVDTVAQENNETFKLKLASCKRAKPLYKSLSKLVCKPRLGGGLKPVSNRFRICCFLS